MTASTAATLGLATETKRATSMRATSASSANERWQASMTVDLPSIDRLTCDDPADVVGELLEGLLEAVGREGFSEFLRIQGTRLKSCEGAGEEEEEEKKRGGGGGRAAGGGGGGGENGGGGAPPWWGGVGKKGTERDEEDGGGTGG